MYLNFCVRPNSIYYLLIFLKKERGGKGNKEGKEERKVKRLTSSSGCRVSFLYLPFDSLNQVIDYDEIRYER